MQPTRAFSTCPRKRNITGIERRVRTGSNPMQGLLSRQLASITDTLAKASQRRDAEFRERKATEPITAPAVPALTPQLSVTSESETSRNSESGDSRAELEQLQRGIEDAAMNVPQTVMHTATVTGVDYPHTSLRGGYGSDDEVDPKTMLAELDQTRQIFNKGAEHEANEDEDPRKMLAELKKRAPSPTQVTIDDDPRAMLADLNRKTQPPDQTHPEDDDDDLEALRGRLTTIRSPLRDRPAQSFAWLIPEYMRAGRFDDSDAPSESHNHTAMALDKRCIPYAVALILEHTNCKWEAARDWTTYLFSSGLDGYVAQQQKDTFVRQATEELDEIIHKVIEKEGRYRRIDEQGRLPRRLIVSNIAAGADENDILDLFSRFEFEIGDIKFLDERDPLKGTRTAYVDLRDREAAIIATYTIGQIFGLQVDIKLAVEKTTPKYPAHNK